MKGPRRAHTALQFEVKALREQGLCCAEIAEKIGKSTNYIRQTCNNIGLPFTDEEKARSIAIGHDKSRNALIKAMGDRSDHYKKYVAERHPGWAWISGRVTSGNVKIRCVSCGNIVEKSANTIRSKDRIVCLTCVEAERQRLQEEQKQERIKEEQKRVEAFWGQKFQQLNMQTHRCKECGVYYFGGRAGYCSEECRRKQANRKHDKRIDRAKRIDKSISLKKLYKRDKGICWLCGGKCDYKDYSKDENGHFIVGANYPSIDHVYPLSKGGDHVWSNVRLAHHYCNTIKSNKVVAYG